MTRRLCAGLGLLLLAPAVRAGQSVEYLPGVDACQAAAAFGQDQSDEAEAARRRCRMMGFRAHIAAKRQERAAEQAAARDAWLRRWQEQNLPTRVGRPFGADGFLGAGFVAKGLAASWLASPFVELEGWVGWQDGEREVENGYVRDDRVMAGGRGKWLIKLESFTPFLALGAGGGWADVSGYRYSDLARTSDYLEGNGRAHFLTAGAGGQLMTKNGFRISFEYFLAWTIYAQVSRTEEPDKPHDEELRQMWMSKLDNERNGFRFAVGYAF